MKFLSDSEILKWNKRLEETDYSAFPVQTPSSSNYFINFRQKIATKFTSPFVGDQFVETVDPFFRYDFTFSIAKNRTQYFEELLERLRTVPFGTKSIYREYLKDNNNKNEKIFDITCNGQIVESVTRVDHKISQKEYTRFNYKFSGKLGSIIAFVSYLEDAIEYFSMIWGYNLDGSEVCLLKFPIGSVVSEKKDKSKDFIVLDYNFSKLDGKYKIDYFCSEIKELKSSIVTYGKVVTLSDDDLTFSRNSRIDNLLNDN